MDSQTITVARTPPSPHLAVSVAGQGPLVLMVHGMGGDRHTWRAQMKALAQQGFTAASVDLRGYGGSGDIEGALDFHRDFGADLLAVLDHFQVPRAHLVGLSMGSRVARSLALRHPERVASLVLADSSPGFDAMGADEVDRFIAERSAAFQGGQVPASFGMDQARAMCAPDAAPEALRSAAEAMQRIRLKNYLAVLVASTRQDRGDRLEQIACPTLVITSDQDRVYPEPVTRQLLARIPGVAHARIERAGHLSNLEQPEAFNRALLAFLR
ncbi:alpha/beta fold hydrolase [Hydrogenophaga sp. UC242_53]|uniref:alpha/beta fold hydrolase n=1 Tax=Hydrogenophaga sp. UC242_53 TaxID=3350170 RepID=UPI0036D23CA5